MLSYYQFSTFFSYFDGKNTIWYIDLATLSSQPDCESYNLLCFISSSKLAAVMLTPDTDGNAVGLE